MKPSRFFTFAAGRPDLEGRRENPCDGQMARFAFEALGIELTEGQPDTSANKANEKKPRTMKKVIAVTGLGAAVALGSLAGAGTASASEDGFLNYVYSKTGYYPATYEAMNTSVAVGHGICNQISTYGEDGVYLSIDQGISSGFSGYDTVYIVAGALTELCPWNWGVAKAAVNKRSGGSLV